LVEQEELEQQLEPREAEIQENDTLGVIKPEMSQMEDDIVPVAPNAAVEEEAVTELVPLTRARSDGYFSAASEFSVLEKDDMDADISSFPPLPEAITVMHTALLDKASALEDLSLLGNRLNNLYDETLALLEVQEAVRNRKRRTKLRYRFCEQAPPIIRAIQVQRSQLPDIFSVELKTFLKWKASSLQQMPETELPKSTDLVLSMFNNRLTELNTIDRILAEYQQRCQPSE
jgi:hypothetical protein